MMDSYRRSRTAGTRPNGFPLHAINWGVVYVNDEQEFSVELLWVNPRWDARMGFVPLPLERRPLPDTHRVERTVSIAAPADRVWSLVTEHRGMPKWFPLDTVTLEREGWPAPNGVGAERVMRGPKMNVREQVERYKQAGDYLKSHTFAALALETAEATAEWLHRKLRADWGFPDPPETTPQDRLQARYGGKRYSFGYPACPDLSGQQQLFAALRPEEIGVELTEGDMMHPEASVSALVFHHPDARYFGV